MTEWYGQSVIGFDFATPPEAIRPTATAVGFSLDYCLCASRTAVRITVMREIFTNIADSLLPAFYRVGSYVVMTMLDDPAILALGFC